MRTPDFRAQEIKGGPRAGRRRGWLRWLFSPGETLSERVIHGGIWIFSLRVADRLFGLARTVVLARLLSPNDFGLFGIALLSMSALETFSQTGFQAALIQKKGDVKPYLDTAWTLQAIRGLVLALILFAVAPSVAAFFDEPAAVPLLRFLGLSMLCQGFTNIGAVYFQRELEFHKQFAHLFSGTLVDVGVAIPAALLLRNSWALILGLVAGNFVRMIASYVIHPYRPKPRLQVAEVRDLYSFGLWIWGIGITGFIAVQADKALVGKLLGTMALGFYGVASRFADTVVMDIGRVVSGVTFPAYSKLQDQPERLKKGFLSSVEIVLFISVPVAVVIVALAPELTSVLLGERWTPIVGALRFLTISGVARGVIAPCAVLFWAMGRPDIDLWLTLTRGVVMVLVAIPLSHLWDSTGVAGASLSGVGIALFVWWRLTLRVMQISRSALLATCAPTLLGSAVMVAAVLLAKAFVAVNGFVTLGEVILVGALGYLVPLLALWWYSDRGPVRHILGPLLGAHVGKLDSKSRDRVHEN